MPNPFLSVGDKGKKKETVPGNLGFSIFRKISDFTGFFFMNLYISNDRKDSTANVFRS